MTVIRKNRSGNTELKKRAHTSVQRNKNKIDKDKQMKNKKYTVDLIPSKKKRLLYINKKRKHK